MIVSRKHKDKTWKNLEGYFSRLSGPCYRTYRVNSFWHRLYGRSYTQRSYRDWDLNGNPFTDFKEF